MSHHPLQPVATHPAPLQDEIQQVFDRFFDDDEADSVQRRHRAVGAARRHQGRGQALRDPRRHSRRRSEATSRSHGEGHPVDQGRAQGRGREQNGKLTRVERAHGVFYRRFALPDSADAEGIAASRQATACSRSRSRSVPKPHRAASTSIEARMNSPRTAQGCAVIRVQLKTASTRTAHGCAAIRIPLKETDSTMACGGATCRGPFCFRVPEFIESGTDLRCADRGCATKAASRVSGSAGRTRIGNGEAHEVADAVQGLLRDTRRRSRTPATPSSSRRTAGSRASTIPTSARKRRRGTIQGRQRSLRGAQGPARRKATTSCARGGYRAGDEFRGRRRTGRRGGEFDFGEGGGDGLQRFLRIAVRPRGRGGGARVHARTAPRPRPARQARRSRWRPRIAAAASASACATAAATHARDQDSRRASSRARRSAWPGRAMRAQRRPRRRPAARNRLPRRRAFRARWPQHAADTLPIAPWEAALGATVPVPTLGGEGRAAHSRRARTRPQTAPARAAAGRAATPGDQIVELEVHVPKAESESRRSSTSRWRRRRFRSARAVGAGLVGVIPACGQDQPRRSTRAKRLRRRACSPGSRRSADDRTS